MSPLWLLWVIELQALAQYELIFDEGTYDLGAIPEIKAQH